jgi:hypothetical protein
MPAFGGVEPAECLDGTPTEGEVEDMAVLEGPHIMAKVERSAEEDGVVERAAKVRVTAAELGIAFAVVTVQAWHPQCEGGYGCKSQGVIREERMGVHRQRSQPFG